MAEIIPRWEWRTFGTDFGLAESAFQAMTIDTTADSDEVYLLSPGRTNVKIRDDLLDIKELQEVGTDGLERWSPIMKAAFPLSAPDLNSVMQSLGVDPQSFDREEYTFDAFIQELINPLPNVRAVDVHKHRVRHTVEGCTSEVTDVIVDGEASRTIAIESEDRAAVNRAVRAVGLAGFENTNYPRGLRDVIDSRAAIYAVIDVGTNSVKFNLGERKDDGSWRTIIDRAEVTRLGEDLDKHDVIVPAAIDRTANAIAAMAEQARDAGALAIVAVGTAGLRIAKNSDDVITAIRDRSGVTVEVLSGPDESRLAYLAVLKSLGLGSETLVVFDTGGGSSQFTFGEGTHVHERFSVNVGAVRYTERFGLDKATSPHVLLSAQRSLSADLSNLDHRVTPDALVGMGGAVTNMMAVSLSMAVYDADLVQGATLDLTEIDRQIDMYRSMSADERRDIVGLQSNRAEVMLAGACIVRTIMAKLSKRSITVSDRGLRHGLTVERFGATSV